MLRRANAQCIVLISAMPVPTRHRYAADATVIGVTATDAEDRLKPQANRGPQVFSGCARG
jgi:hypothetical protein